MYSYAHVYLFFTILWLEPLHVRWSSLISSADLCRHTFIRKKIREKKRGKEITKKNKRKKMGEKRNESIVNFIIIIIQLACRDF